jgi:hypothetical protein
VTATKITGQGDGACTYKVSFVSDVTIPDNTVIPAGASFVKTWRVRNDGTCTWGPNGHALHALAFVNGSQMDAPAQVPLPATVNPGQTVDISVTFKAPTTPGTYVSLWLLRIDNDPSGAGPFVGLGPQANQGLYVKIQVGSGSGGTPATRLNFTAGATSINVDGSVQPNATNRYLLAAQKDQIIMANLSPSAKDARLKITASDNTALQSSTSADGTDAMAALPSTQDYIVSVTGGSQATNYTLSISIPSRITFEPGGTSATVNGKVTNHFQVSYVLRALAGQTMTVNLTGSNVGLTIYGLQDGQPLVRAVGGATSFNGKLPITQDYILNVVPAVDSTTFTMTVTVN